MNGSLDYRIFSLFTLISVCSARIINVPTDQPTIQDGIDAAVDGDTVLVEPGTYVENIDYTGKNLVVASLFITTGDTSYISQTVIDGDSSGSVVVFKSGEDSTAVLGGFTITNGLAIIFPFNGGGIYCEDSAPTLMNLRIVDNSAIGPLGTGSGGGIYCSYSSPALKNLTVSENWATENGGGISCIYSNPSLMNVTITGNKAFSGYSDADGGGLYFSNSTPSLISVMVNRNTATWGGGIYCEDSSPSFETVTVSENAASKNGGGISLFSSTASFLTARVSLNVADEGGGIYCFNSSLSFDDENRSNIYLNIAHGKSGSDLYAYESPIIKVAVDTFTVMNPTNYHASPVDNFTFDILHSKVKPVEADLYVSPEGHNGNSGQSASEPLGSISYALAKILADSLHPHTIYLSNGKYSPSTNKEHFPLHMMSYVSLSGESESGVILDAQNQGGVMVFNEDHGIAVENMTVTGGLASSGAGIHMSNSSPSLRNVTISGNTAKGIEGFSWGLGGGIFSYKSNPRLVNVTLSDNKADNQGGGVYLRNSIPSLVNVKISGNSATGSLNSGFGGGIYCSYSSWSLSNVTISENAASYGGGGIYFSGSSPSFDSDNRCNIYFNHAPRGSDLSSISSPKIEVVVDTFTVMNPTGYHASPVDKFTFDILHAKVELLDSDLYVTVTGDDANTGLLPSEPLHTISFALSKILADSLNPHKIYVSEGVYSPSTNGEHFPLKMVSHVSISGASEDGVILNGESLSGVMYFDQAQGVSVENLTITGGRNRGGAGILCKNSSPYLTNVTISGNTADGTGGYVAQGGGIAMSGSSPTLRNVTIIGNTATGSGGGISGYSSNPSLVNVTISDNSTYGSGGGIYCNSSSPRLEDVTISGNLARWDGGGIECYESSPSLVYVTLSNNTSEQRGGGIFSIFSTPSLKNVTISSNAAGEGAGIYCYASDATVVNTIFWNDSPEEVYFSYTKSHGSNSITIAHSDVQGGERGIVTSDNGTVSWLEGNIDADPLFVDPENSDFRLQEDSPCIDAGIALFVWEGDTLVDLPDNTYEGNAPDMGAFESPYNVGTIPESNLPMEYTLHQNHPNPFNLVTTIRYELPRFSQVSLIVYDILGREVAQLLDNDQNPGLKEVQWNAADVPSGIYFIQMQVGDFRQVRKVMVLK